VAYVHADGDRRLSAVAAEASFPHEHADQEPEVEELGILGLAQIEPLSRLGVVTPYGIT
jgi:hypothetical protein